MLVTTMALGLAWLNRNAGRSSLTSDLRDGKQLQVRELVDAASFNEPPQFETTMFQPDSFTIQVPARQLDSALILQATDDSDTPYNGLVFTEVGGRDKDLIGISPPGVFIFMGRPEDSIYEIDVAVCDNSEACYAHLERLPGQRLRLIKERLARGGKIATEILSDDCGLDPDVIDFATADGKTFYHVHGSHDGPFALQKSLLNEDGTFSSTLLNQDCGIMKPVIGLATDDGQNFRYLTLERNGAAVVTLHVAKLNADGTFTTTDSAPTNLPAQLTGFSWLDTNRFQHVRWSADGGGQFVCSFLQGSQFTNLNVHDTCMQYNRSPTAHAAWIEHRPESKVTTQRIRLEMVD